MIMNMKKIAYLSVLAGLFMAACTPGDYGILPADPQTNEQEEFVTLPEGVTAAAVNPIDLAKVEGDSVAVATFTPVSVAEGDFKYTIVVDDKYEYVVAEDMKVPVADLQAMVEEVYGKRPTERTFTAVLNVDVIVDGQASLLTSAKFDLKLIPEAPFIDKAYYLVGNMCAVYNAEKGEFEGGWDKASAKKFNHSGKDVYEDSEFSIIVKLPVDAEGKPSGDGYYWKVIPAGNYDNPDPDAFWAESVTGVVGVAKDGDDAKEGKLVTEKPQAAKINFNKDEESMNLYKITINMMDYTYKVEELNFVEYIYVPGNHQSWKPELAPALHGANFDGVWTGYSMLDGGFKFTQERKWAAEYKGSDFTTLPEGFTSPDGGNIEAAKKAFYYIKADVANSKLEVTEIKSYGIIGDATPGGWDADTDMTWDAEKMAFVIKGVTLKDGKVKFRANDDWGVNVGGSFDDLTDGGADIVVTAGTYDIELYLQRTPESKEKMTAKVTKK